MDDLKSQAKIEKLKELRRLLREIIAEEGGDSPMSEGDVEDLLEEADESEMAEPEGAYEEDLPIKEASEEEMAEPEAKVSELEMLKREYFKPKMGGKAPGREGAKTVIVASQAPQAPMPMAEKIPMPKRASKGKMA